MFRCASAITVDTDERTQGDKDFSLLFISRLFCVQKFE